MSGYVQKVSILWQMFFARLKIKKLGLKAVKMFRSSLQLVKMFRSSLLGRMFRSSLVKMFRSSLLVKMFRSSQMLKIIKGWSLIRQWLMKPPRNLLLTVQTVLDSLTVQTKIYRPIPIKQR